MRKQARRIKRSWELAEIARRKLAGESLATIGKALGLSPSQVSARLAQLKRQWTEETEVDKKLVRVQDLGALKRVERELWAASEVSEQPRVTTRTTVREGLRPYARRSVETTHREGSPKIAVIIAQAKMLRAEILGLYPEEPTRPRRSTASGERALPALPLAHIDTNLIFAELKRRYGVAEVWIKKPIFPIADELPPGSHPRRRQGMMTPEAENGHERT